MVPNAAFEELKIKYAHLNELTWPDSSPTTSRITRVGKILRKTSLT